MTAPLLSLLAAGTAATQGPPWWTNIPLFVGMGLVMWLLFFRPQMKQQKEQKAKLGAMKKGDQVLTAGGLIGKVVKLDETYVEVELAPSMRVKALRSTISDVIPPGGTPAAND
jgi:preprotein translocase subunit YajC